LVAVVLRDRDDQAEVALDHAPLRLHVAALDPLGELDLVGGRQQRVAPDLAEKELQRVGRRFEDLGVARGSRRLSSGLLRGLDDLDAALLQLLVERLDFGGLDLERIQGLRQLGSIEKAGRLAALEQMLDLLVLEGGLVVCHLTHAPPGLIQRTH
jgi:hypothetical protein